MALVVEDGSGIAGANSFATEAEIVAYAAQRGVVMTEEEATKFGFEAMDYFATICFGGDAVYDTPFPRAGFLLSNRVEMPADTIPAPIKRAQMQLALDAKRGIALVTSSSNSEQVVKKEKVGPIETEFFSAADSGAALNVPTLPIATALIDPFTCANQPFRVRTYRA